MFAGWPGNSPDLNPIEKSLVPDKASAKKRTRDVKGGNQERIKKVWRAITPEYLNSLNESMPRRMAAVIAAGGGHTKY